MCSMHCEKVIMCSSVSRSAHHIGHRQQSPGGGQAVRNSNLRVVIPAPMNSGMQTNDEISYNEVCLSLDYPYERYLRTTKNLISPCSPQHRQQTTLNTPVVALQTPNIAYPNLGSFGPQDFSMNSSDVMGLSNWNHPNISTVQHTR